jgi:cell division protein FtsW (lipid II flippase)
MFGIFNCLIPYLIVLLILFIIMVVYFSKYNKEKDKNKKNSYLVYSILLLILNVGFLIYLGISIDFSKIQNKCSGVKDYNEYIDPFVYNCACNYFNKVF